MAEMTREAIVASCKANGGYASPHLNDQLYLHCKGFINIQNLEEYKNVKVLWLEQNAIRDITGLEQQEHLVSLFLQNNTIANLSGLKKFCLRNLKVLNISHNYITSLEGLSVGCPTLETLQASHNYISSLEACEELWNLSDYLTSVDLSFNKIDQYRNPAVGDGEEEVRVVLQGVEGELEKLDASVVVDFFKKLPNVSVIYLQGNGIVRGIKQYRRNMVLHLDALTYLDERPVFPEERRVVQAWGTGGDEAEADERAAIREEKKEHLNSCVRVLTEKMEANRETRDRLTKQWEEKRQNEMDILTERRRQFRDEVDNIVRLESMGRTALEKEEQNVMWDLEEAQDRERKSVQASSTEEKKECPVSPKETLLVEELLENSSPSEENDTAQLLGELQKSDEEILREMEEEIQQVLEGISSRERHTDPMHFDRVTNKSERKVHEAVGVTAERFRRNSDRSGKEELWKSFDAWDRRGSK